MRKKLSTWLPRVAALVAFFVLFYIFICHWWKVDGYGSPYISDFLAYPHVAINLIHQHGNYFDWVFTNLCFFFPDFILCLAITLFFKNPALIVLVYAFVQIGYFILIGKALINRAVADGRMRRAAVLLMLFALWLVVHPKSLPSDTQSVFAAVLANISLPAIHFGCTVMILTLLFLLLVIFKRPEKKFILLFSLLLVLTGGSDPLLFGSFIIPVLATLTIAVVFRRISWRAYLKLAVWLSVLAVLAWLLYRNGPFAIASYVRVQKHRIQLNVADVYSIIHMTFLRISHWIEDSPFVGNMWLAFVIFTPISLITKRGTKPIDFILLTLFLQIISGLLVFFCFRPVIEAFPIRYLQPLLVIPAFIGPLLLLAKHWPTCRPFYSAKSYYGILLFMVLSTLAVPHPPFALSKKIHYYPQEVACLDQHVKKLGLTAGIAGYHDLHPFTIFSRTGVVIASVDKDTMAPILWNNSRESYRNRHFDFVITKPHKQTERPGFPLVKSLLGVPDSTFNCGQYLIAVYQHGQIDRFLASHSGYSTHKTWLFRTLAKKFGYKSDKAKS